VKSSCPRTISLLKYIETGFWEHGLAFWKKKKKETGTVEDDFTFNVVLHHDDLTLFCKKKFKRPFFTNSWSKWSLFTKKPVYMLSLIGYQWLPSKGKKKKTLFVHISLTILVFWDKSFTAQKGFSFRRLPPKSKLH